MQYRLSFVVCFLFLLSSCTPSPSSVLKKYMEGNLNIAHVYVAKGGDVNIHVRDKEGVPISFLMAAIQMKDKGLINSILHRPDFNINLEASLSDNSLIQCVVYDDIETLNTILPMYSDVNIGYKGGTALTFAAATNAVQALDLLLKHPSIRVDKTMDYKGSTALHVAAIKAHPEATRILLENGATRDIKNKDGKTPEARVLDAINECEQEISESYSQEDILHLQKVIDRYQQTLKILRSPSEVPNQSK